MPYEVPCDLFDQIEVWTQTVSQQADHSVQPPPPSPRNLRPRPVPRPKSIIHHSRYLAPTSANPRIRKAPWDEEKEGYSAAARKPSKRAKKMSGNTGGQGDPVKEHDMGGKKRGRPAGSKKQPQPILTPSEILVPSSPSKASSKAKSRSPKRAKSFVNPRTDASIDLAYLRTCKPSVVQRTLAEALETELIPSETMSLYQKLIDVPDGCIPAKLKAKYDQEIQPRLNASYFLPSDQSPFPADRLQSLKQTVDGVVKSTASNFRRDVHERQWEMTTVTPLITQLQYWPEFQHCLFLNVETCAIDPVEVRMERPDGQLLEIATTHTREDSSESPSTTSRMVDLSIALDLNKNDEDIADSAFSKLPDNAHSLNQSLSYIKDVPLFVDIELKKANSARDARVQLAIWKAAGFKKMQYHGWDTSMPMPGITVDADVWMCYLFFVRGSGLIMLGPLEMGSTRDVRRTFQIVYNLYILMKWGKTDYEAWFKKHILTWCQHKAAGTMPVDAGLTSLHL